MSKPGIGLQSSFLPKHITAEQGYVWLCRSKQRKGYPFELALPAGCTTTGVVLCDQMRSLDWKARQATLKGTVGLDFARQILARFLPLVTW